RAVAAQSGGAPLATAPGRRGGTAGGGTASQARAAAQVTFRHDGRGRSTVSPQLVSGADTPIPGGLTARWRLHRGGIVNIWQYAETEFDFSGGRAIFQGTNGSGKSRKIGRASCRERASRCGGAAPP